MVTLRRLVLDVLKPRDPDALEFAGAIAERNRDCRVTVTVTEVDQKTETTVVSIAGRDISYTSIVETIRDLGGSIHSIDEVEVDSVADTD